MYRHLARGDRPQDGCKGLAGGSPGRPARRSGLPPTQHMVMDLADLVDRFRVEADKARRYAPGAASAWEDAAQLLEEHLHGRDDELLNLTQAAAESGYSTDSLRRFLTDGLIEDHGGPYRPRICRADLPRKPGHGRPPKPTQRAPGPDLASERLRDRGVLTIPGE